MNKPHRHAALLVVSCLLVSTAALAGDPERVALDAAIQRWTTAVNAQDVEALKATMTEDVELLDELTMVTGREAAVGALRDVANRGKLGATNREITIASPLAWRVAAFTQTQKGGDVHARGQALEIWKCVKGQWKLHRQMSAGLISPVDLLFRPSTKEPVLDRPTN